MKLEKSVKLIEERTSEGMDKEARQGVQNRGRWMEKEGGRGDGSSPSCHPIYHRVSGSR